MSHFAKSLTALLATALTATLTYLAAKQTKSPNEVTAAVTAAYVALVYFQLRAMESQRRDQLNQYDQNQVARLKRAEERKSAIAEAIVSELDRIQCVLCDVCLFLCLDCGMLDSEWLQWATNVAERCPSTPRRANLIQNINLLQQKSPGATHKKGIQLSVMPPRTTFTDSIVQELHIFNPLFQQAVLAVKSELDTFEQWVKLVNQMGNDQAHLLPRILRQARQITELAEQVRSQPK